MTRKSTALSMSIMLLATGCASIPNGPSVMVLPGAGQSFDQFRYDDAICQQFAYGQVGGTTANDAAVESGVASAAVGTVLGAAAGAALGGARGAAMGAGTGLLAGGLVGSASANTSRVATQERYDAAYIQCMYAKGHQVPVSGHIPNIQPQNFIAPRAATIPPPPPGASSPSLTTPPPPPAGSPPPPPPQ